MKTLEFKSKSIRIKMDPRKKHMSTLVKIIVSVTCGIVGELSETLGCEDFLEA